MDAFDGEEKLRIVPSEDRQRGLIGKAKLLRSWLAQKRKTALNRWDICFDVPILMKKSIYFVMIEFEKVADTRSISLFNNAVEFLVNNCGNVEVVNG